MDAWNFARIKTYLIFAGALWALLAFVAWHYESTCGMFLSGSCWATYWAGLRRVLLLKWVEDYQTLVAGLLAFAAGTFAYTATSLKIKHEQAAESRRRTEEQGNACAILAADFFMAFQTLVKSISDANTIKQSTALRIIPHPQTFKVYEIDRHLGMALTAIQEAAHDYQNLDEDMQRITSVECLMLAQIFRQAADEIYESGLFSLQLSSVTPSHHLLTIMKDLGVTVDDVDLLAPFLDWSEFPDLQN
jgi:hypothetical protein